MNAILMTSLKITVGDFLFYFVAPFQVATDLVDFTISVVWFQVIYQDDLPTLTDT